MQIGQIVGALIERHGLTFDAVAERVRAQGATNVRYQHIQQLLEYPNRRPRYLPELARAFGLTVEEFLAFKVDVTSSSVKEAAGVYQSSHALRIDPETIAAALQLVRLAFRNLKLEIDQEENGEPLAFAYQYLHDRQERVVTGENVVDFSARLQQRLREALDDAHGEGELGNVGGTHRQHSQRRKAT